MSLTAFRNGDPAYALVLPIEHVAVGSDVAAEPTPVWDTMVTDGLTVLLEPLAEHDGHYCDACRHPHGYHASGGCAMPLGPSGAPHGRNEPCVGVCGCPGSSPSSRLRAYWTTGPGSEPIGHALDQPPATPPFTKGQRDTCSLCGRDTALRRDGSLVRHHNPATNEPCVGFNSPPRDAAGRFTD